MTRARRRTAPVVSALAAAIAAWVAAGAAGADARAAPAGARERVDAAETRVRRETRLVRRRRPRPMLPDRARCHRLPGVRPVICDGPRRVPMPTIAAAERAARLGLGTHAAADALVVGAPPTEWVREVGSAPARTLLWPVANGLLSRGFGVARLRASSRGTHPGVDLVGAEGTPLRAVADGLVAYADNGVRGMGNALFVVHADASVSIYAHCRALRVAAGELVRRGQIVGELGATGLTFRAHLHYEWRVGGRPRDPMRRFVERPDGSLRSERDGEVTWAAPPPNHEAPPTVPPPPAEEAGASADEEAASAELGDTRDGA